MTHKQRLGTNRNSYLNIICIKLVTQVKIKLKFGPFEIFQVCKNLKKLSF